MSNTLVIKKNIKNLNSDLINRINLFLKKDDSLRLRRVNKFFKHTVKDPVKLRKIDFIFHLVDQKQKKFTNIDLSGLLLKNIHFLKGTRFWSCNLNKTKFINCTLEKCSFSLYTNLKECQFINCNMNNCKITYCNLQFVDFSDSNLNKCNFSKSIYNSYTIFNDKKNYIDTKFNTRNMRYRSIVE